MCVPGGRLEGRLVEEEEVRVCRRVVSNCLAVGNVVVLFEGSKSIMYSLDER